jgi:hypothetical protein
MATLSFDQLEQLWTGAGGAPQWAPTAAGIALAESSGNPNALNNNPSTGDYSVGLWQINYFGSLAPTRTAAYGPPSQLLGDPEAQAAAAVNLSGNGANWSPWASDPVGNAAMRSRTPMTAQQVQQLLGSSGSATLVSSDSTTFPTLPGVGSAFGIPSTPPHPPSNPFDIGGDFAFIAEFGGWAIFTALVFITGMALLVTGGVMIGMVILGPVTGPVGEAIAKGTPIGRASGLLKRSVAKSKATKPKTGRSEDEEFDIGVSQGRRAQIRAEGRKTGKRHITGEHGHSPHDFSLRPGEEPFETPSAA